MAEKLYPPTITVWNRLEGRPRTSDFTRALKAQIRDPLWMLCKQWQMGEFQGEDAASPILAKVHISKTSLTKYQPGEDTTVSFATDTPLEVQVEHQHIPFQLGGQEISLDLRLLMGRHWLKLLKKNDFSLGKEFLAIYPIQLPNPDSEADVQICAHLEVWQQMVAVANRRMDGYKLYQDLQQPGALVTDKVTAPVGEEQKLNDLGEKFTTWFEKLFYQPSKAKNPSWKPAYLEHQFACSAPKGNVEQVFIADEYFHGHMDWYNLDIHDKKERLPDSADAIEPNSVKDTFTLSFLPTSITFPGMPHSRWWTFEDWRINLGDIKPDTTDINQLLVLDFALNYSNDWFMLPFTLPVGSIANVEGLMVTNVFGERTWVEAAGKGLDEDWNRWSMFHLNTRGQMDKPADLSLLLLPVVPKILEGKPLEEVFLLRDEVANMVWGVESMIPLATGKSKAGKEAGAELKAKYQQFVEPSQPLPLSENEAKIQYQIVNTVPEEWIPFIPVHKENDNRQIQLQRAAMPRILEGADNTKPPAKIEPRTSILREGLDKEVPLAYFLHEEEVPRSGIRVHKSFQRTRWENGKVFVWVGFRKQMGRGEGHSGLVFDQIIPKKQDT